MSPHDQQKPVCHTRETSNDNDTRHRTRPSSTRSLGIRRLTFLTSTHTYSFASPYFSCLHPFYLAFFTVLPVLFDHLYLHLFTCHLQLVVVCSFRTLSFCLHLHSFFTRSAAIPHPLIRRATSHLALAQSSTFTDRLYRRLFSHVCNDTIYHASMWGRSMLCPSDDSIFKIKKRISQY